MNFFKRNKQWDTQIWNYFLSENKNEKVQMYTGIDKNYFDYMIDYLYNNLPNNLDSIFIIDLRSNIAYLAKQNNRDIIKVFKKIGSKVAITLNFLNFVSFEVSPALEVQQKNEYKYYKNNAERYYAENIKEFKMHSNFIIFADDEKAATAEMLALRIEDEQKRSVIISSLSKSGNSDVESINGLEINEILIKKIDSILSESSQKLSLVLILVSFQVIKKLSLLHRIDLINTSEYSEIISAYKKKSDYNYAFSIQYLDKYKNKTSAFLLKHSKEVISAIRIVEEFDPYNFNLLGKLYNLIDCDLEKEYLNIQKYVLAGLVYKINYKNNLFESKEGKIIEEIQRFQEKNSKKATCVTLSNEVVRLYELFLQCYREKFSFGVLQLGILIQAQATSYGLTQIVFDVVAKMDLIKSLIEGIKSQENLIHIQKFEKLLTRTIYPPNEIPFLFSDIDKDIDDITFTYSLSDYICSNLLGYFAFFDKEYLLEKSEYLMSGIYKKFLDVYLDQEDKEVLMKSEKILNNLAIYELKRPEECNGEFTKQLLEMALNSPDDFHIITLYNILGILLHNTSISDSKNIKEYYFNNFELGKIHQTSFQSTRKWDKNDKVNQFNAIYDVYKKKLDEKRHDDFYMFFNHYLEFYLLEKQYGDINIKKIPKMYHNQFMEKLIIEEIENKKTAVIDRFLFIDNQFWFNENLK